MTGLASMESTVALGARCATAIVKRPHPGKNTPFPDTDASLVFFRGSGRGGDLIFTSTPAFSTPDLVPVGVAIGALQKTALRRR